MAFENIQSTEEVTSPEQTSNTLDLSNVDSPLDSFNGLNLQSIEERSKLLEIDTPNTAKDLDQQPPAGPGDGVKQSKTKQDYINEAKQLYDYNKTRSKIFAQNVGKIAGQEVNPSFAYGDYTFDRYKTNMDRYLGYGKSTFRELGFNPLEDNESYYNKNVSAYRDWIRMSGHFGTLLGSAFTSTYRSVGNMISGGSALTLDMKGESEFSKANRLGSSSRGGLTGFGVNLALNSAYTLGITANIVAEEMAIWLAGTAFAPETGGASLAAAAALEAVEGASIAARINRVRKIMSGAYNMTTLGSVTKGSYQMLKSLYRADEAKNFWQGAKVFTQGLNPLRQTTALGYDIYKGTEGYKNLSNLAKMSRGFGAFYRDTREAMFTISESQLEGAGVTQELINNHIDTFTKDNNGRLPTGQALDDIYKNAYAAGRVDVLGNIPLIYLTNRITFDGLFKFKGIKSLIEAAEKSAPSFGKSFVFNIGEKTFAESAKEGLLKTTFKAITKPKTYLGTFLSYTKHNLSEGLQELGQEWLADATKKRYERLYKDPYVSQSDLLKASVWSGLGSTVFSKEAGSAVKDQIFSSQGLNTFLSGFLMGGLVGGGKASMSTLANGIWNRSAELYLKKTSPEKFEEYIKAKQELKDKHLEILNNLFSNPEDFFSRKKESLVIQNNANNNLENADSNNDDKTFYDNKDEKTLDHVFASLDAGTFDTLLDGFKELGKLSDEDLADYFNIQDGAKARQKLDEYVGRAKEIKNRYDYVNDKFKNPFDPKKYQRGTPEQVNEFIAYRAFQDAKKEAIASQYGFDRTVERMESVYQDLSKDKPIRSSSESDYNVLFDPKTIKAEVALLNEEAELLEKGEKPGDKALAKIKREKAEALKEYLENYSAYKKKKGKEIYNENGQIELMFDEDLLQPLKKSYQKYLKTVAKLNDDYVFDDKIDNSFNKILDYYSLDEDARKYTQTINYLSNPENLIRHADRINVILNDIYENRFKLQEEGLDKYLSYMEFNNLILDIGRFGIIVDPEELIELAKTGKAPETFFDLKNNKLIDKNDNRYNALLEKIYTYKALRERDEQNQPEVKEEEVKSVEEVKQTEPEKKETPSTELDNALREAYNNFIAETGSDVDFEEFVRDHPTAHTLKKKAAAGTVQPTAQPEEKVIELKLPEIETIKEGELAVGDRVKINTEKDGESVIKEDRGDKVLLEDGRQVAKKNITKLEKTPEVKAEKVEEVTSASYNVDQPLEDKVKWIKENTLINRSAFNSNKEYVDHFEKQRSNIIDSIKSGMSKENILTNNGYINFEKNVDKYFNELLNKHGITENEIKTETPKAEEKKVETPTAAVSDLGFQNLGNIGNQGLAIMEADLLKQGRYILTNIASATPEQLEKIENDIKTLQSKYDIKVDRTVRTAKGPAIVITLNKKTTATTPVSDTDKKANVEIVTSIDKLKSLNQVFQSPTGKFGIISAIDYKTILWSDTLEIATKKIEIERRRRQEIIAISDEMLNMSEKQIIATQKDRLQKYTVVNAKYDAELDALEGKPAETPEVKEQTVEEKIKQIESRIQTLNEFIGNTDSNAAIVASEKQIAQLEKELKELKKSQTSASKEKIGNILSGVKSLSEFPSTNLNDNSEITNKLLKLISEGEATAAEVITEVKAKYEEMIKNLKPNDFKKGDIVTFTDGTKGIVNSISDKSVNIKRFNTPKGEVDIIEAKDLSKRVKMVKGSKEAIQEEKETPAVEVGKEDKQAIQQSQNTADGLISDATKAKNIIGNGIKDAEKGEDLGFDDLLLGCD